MTAARCEAETHGIQCERESLHEGFHCSGDERAPRGALYWGDAGEELIGHVKTVLERREA